MLVFFAAGVSLTAQSLSSTNLNASQQTFITATNAQSLLKSELKSLDADGQSTTAKAAATTNASMTFAFYMSVYGKLQNGESVAASIDNSYQDFVGYIQKAQIDLQSFKNQELSVVYQDAIDLLKL